MNKFTNAMTDYINYVVIGVVSLAVVTFLPLIGSTAGLGFKVPDTIAGWIVWAVVRVIMSLANVFIFHCFILQGKKKAKETDEYKKAHAKLVEIYKLADKKKGPRSPIKWNTIQYGKKGTTIFISTAVCCFAITQAILMYDWLSLITYCISIIMGVLFGIMQMNNTFEYYTQEFCEWVDIEYDKYIKDVIVNDNI